MSQLLCKSKKESAINLNQDEQSLSTSSSETDESEYAFEESHTSLAKQSLSPLKQHAQPPTTNKTT